MERRRSKTEKADAARRRAALDCHEAPMWAIEAALIAAYDAGRASVRGCE